MREAAGFYGCSREKNVYVMDVRAAYAERELNDFITGVQFWITDCSVLAKARRVDEWKSLLLTAGNN